MYSALYRHESNTQSRNFITFLQLKNIIFGKTNFLVIHLWNNYEFSYEDIVMDYEIWVMGSIKNSS
jgi:hypothetical protein